MRNKMVGLVALGSLLLAASAHAAVDTDVSAAVTDATGLWTLIKPVVLGIVVFGIAIAFLRKLKSR